MKKMLYGFTLLEVLIAMSILGIMLVLLFGSFAKFSRSWSAGEEHVHKVEQMAMVQNFFRTRLSAAGNETTSPSAGSEEDADAGQQDVQLDEERAFFQGKEQYLQFVSLLPESAARGGWYLFKVGIKPRSASLYVAMTPFLPVEERQPPESEDLEILPDMETLALAYWGKKEEDDKPQWHKEWLNMPVLPELVSINIKLRYQNAWPTLVVAPRLAPVHVNYGG
jgi:general secretion pathway protein J